MDQEAFPRCCRTTTHCLSMHLWGDNSTALVSSSSSQGVTKRPVKTTFAILDAPLRDIALAESHAAAVDHRGTVLQWGTGHASAEDREGADVFTSLQGKDILSVQASEKHIWALSRRGEVFVLPASRAEAQRWNVAQGGRSALDWAKAVVMPWRLFTGTQGRPYEMLRPDHALRWGERIQSISCGTSHLLALSSHGRAFALPLSESANEFGQLGTRRVRQLSTTAEGKLVESEAILAPDTSEPVARTADPRKMDPWVEQLTEAKKDVVPARRQSRAALARSASEQQLYSRTLHLIPSLSNIPIAILRAGNAHSLALTATSPQRAISWGSNVYGQLGLGQLAQGIQFVTVPSEIVFPVAATKGRGLVNSECRSLVAAGDTSYFVVERQEEPVRVTEPSGKQVIKPGSRWIDLLASGHGQFGGIGNSSWSNANAPTKVKTVSGLLEWSEAAQKILPIDIAQVAAGRAHVAVVLDNAIPKAASSPSFWSRWFGSGKAPEADSFAYGRDVFVFGQNMSFQLGTGKRNNLATPQHLPPLPTKTPAPLVERSAEAALESGTTSPMPHNRLQLTPRKKIEGKWCVETMVAGPTTTGVYWRILNP